MTLHPDFETLGHLKNKHPDSLHAFLEGMKIDRRFVAFGGDYISICERAIFLSELAKDSDNMLKKTTASLAGRVARRFFYEKSNHLYKYVSTCVPSLMQHLSPHNQARLARVFSKRLAHYATQSETQDYVLRNAVVIGHYLPKDQAQKYMREKIECRFEDYQDEPYSLNYPKLHGLFEVLRQLPQDMQQDFAGQYQAVIRAANPKLVSAARSRYLLQASLKLLPRNKRFDVSMAFVDSAIDAPEKLEFLLCAHSHAQNDTQRADVIEKAVATGLLVKDTPRHLVGAVQDMFRRSAAPVRVLDGGVTVWNGVRTPCFAQKTGQNDELRVRFYALSGTLNEVQDVVNTRYTPNHPRRSQFNAFKQALNV